MTEKNITCKKCRHRHPAGRSCADAKSLAEEARAKQESAKTAEEFAVGRKPEYRLKALNRATGERSRNAGAAWVNEDGSISIDVEPFIVLQGGKDLVLTLFPEMGRKK